MLKVRKDGSRAESRSRGQVLIEVLLMLPVFMFIVFMIMEIGHLSFRTILLHHCAYEAARIASLSSTRAAAPGCPSPNIQWPKVRTMVNQMLPGARLVMAPNPMPATLQDPQEGCPNYDVIVIVQQTVPMIFPMTGMALGNAGRSARLLTAKVRMPVERPLFK